MGTEIPFPFFFAFCGGLRQGVLFFGRKFSYGVTFFSAFPEYIYFD